MGVVGTSATFFAQSREDSMHIDMARLFDSEEFVAAVVLVALVGITRRAHVVVWDDPRRKEKTQVQFSDRMKERDGTTYQGNPSTCSSCLRQSARTRRR